VVASALPPEPPFVPELLSLTERDIAPKVSALADEGRWWRFANPMKADARRPSCCPIDLLLPFFSSRIPFLSWVASAFHVLVEDATKQRAF